MEILRGLLGASVLLGVAWLFSVNRRAVDWRLVLAGLSLQVIFGLLILKVDFIASGFYSLSAGFVTLVGFSANGAKFLFGNLADSSGSAGFVFAFQALPTIIFFSTVTAGLYYLGILQKIVYVIAWVMARTMRLSGAESLSAAGNIFLGQTEAPLLVKPFIPNMTRSEIMCLMTGGMATIAGSVLATYVRMLGGPDEASQAQFASYLLTASLMNAPAAIVFAKVLVPEPDLSRLDTRLRVNEESLGVNLIDAMSIGAIDGLKLALNVGGMLLAFIGVIALINFVFSDVIGEWTFFTSQSLNAWVKGSTNGTFSAFSLEYLLGQIFRLAAWAMGIAWQDTLLVGSLLGQKTVINEFVAYSSLADLKNAGLLESRSILISTYALCGFSNFSSIAIQIGGIGGLAPNQQGQLSKLGLRALLAATLACMLTATVAGAMS